MNASAPADRPTPRLKVAISTWTKFHLFHLARHFHAAGMLQQIFTNLPRYRLAEEGLPPSVIEAHPFPAILFYAAKRYQVPLPAVAEHVLQRAFDDSQQHFITRRLEDCDTFVALSGAGLYGGRLTQSRGGRYICERASSHIGWQRDILAEEFRRFGQPAPYFDARLVDKELQEYEAADAVVVPSGFVRQSFVDRGVDPTKLFVNPYSVDLTAFGRDPTVRDDDEFRVVWVGQVSLRKGIPYLLKAFARLSHPRKRLAIAGAVHPEMREPLKTLPMDHVELLGPQNKAQVRALLNRSDVFCIASIEEGMAYATVEAMACGLPVVATHNTGAGEIVQDGREGFLVEARNEVALGDRLEQLASDPILRDAMADAAWSRVQSIGGWGQFGDRYIRLIEDLCARPPRAAAYPQLV